MKYQPDLYLITPLTNLHAGSGDTTYGIVDKEVQRDAVNKIPVVHASSLKGAFRESLAHRFKADKGQRNPTVEYIFGKYIKGGQANETLAAGNYLFFEAKLLALPVRSNHRPYYHAVSPGVLREFFQQLENFHAPQWDTLEEGWKKAAEKLHERLDKPRLRKDETISGLLVEEFDGFNVNDDDDWEALLESLKTAGLLPAEVILFSDKDFGELCERLPVIARNNLDNGISVNLWYEEVVPRQSRFYTFILRPEKPEHDLDTNLPINRLVQVGGNATVGYGQCHVARLS